MAGLDEWLPPASAGTETGLQIAQVIRYSGLVLLVFVMRKVVLGVGITIDGYIARPNGDVDFLFMPGDFSMAPFFASIDTAIMGRKTYEVSLKLGGSFSKSIASFVLSRTLSISHRDGLTITSQSPAALVRDIRRRSGKNIWLMGGGEVAREFLNADLVDELSLGIIPLLLGDGIRLFPAGFPQRSFALVENKTYSKGLVELKYRRVRSKAKAKP